MISKKPSLDPVDLSNYHPVSNLLYLSKELERVVAEQFSGFLEDISVLEAIPDRPLPQLWNGDSFDHPHRLSP